MISKAISSKWSNTIDGQRRAKLEAKARREEEEELARQRVDIEEELWRATERKNVIERAKKLQFEDNDRTKEFHSALGFVEVLKEREMQIAERGSREQKRKLAEEEFCRQVNAENSAAKALEEARSQKRREECVTNQEEVLQQIATKREVSREAQREWETEGHRLAQLAEVEKEEKARQAALESEKKKETKFFLDNQLAVSKQIQAQEVQMNQIEENKRQIYSKAKQKMMQMRQASFKAFSHAIWIKWII